MTRPACGLRGTGSAVPERILDNHELEIRDERLAVTR